MVGRPFLRDHQLVASLGKNSGPVHIIGCHKGATETQAAALLGFPDTTIVAAPFGVYVVDPIQKVQFLFLQNCRDQTTARFAAQRFFEWLGQSGEEASLVARATSRAQIVQAIAREMNL